MPNFAIKKDERIQGSIQDFYKLYMDGVCLIDEFQKDITDQHRGHLRGIYTIMQQVADGKFPPGTKWHKLDGDCELYEGKHTKGMRVYCHHRKDVDKIILLGSTQKTKQSRDISEAERMAQALPRDIRILETEEDLDAYIAECEKEKLKWIEEQ